MKEASQLVNLSSYDLSDFSNLKEQLVKDISQIRKQNDETTALPNRTSWMITNLYYLKQIDSLKYVSLFLKLKDKLVDDIHVNNNGAVIFTLKENTQMNNGNYNETYNHELISGDCNCEIN